MLKVDSYEQINAIFSFVKSLKKGFVTNFFLDSEKVSNLCSREILHYVKFDEGAFILHTDNTFLRLFYCVSSETVLEKYLNLFLLSDKNSTYVVDIIERLNRGNSIESYFIYNNFYKHETLRRMSKITEIHEEIFDNVSYAKIEHLDILKCFFTKYFDPYSEQIPTSEEIVSWIQNKNIFIYSEEKKICGFLISEQNGVTSYLRYWFTHPDYRNKKVGSELLRTFFRISNNTKRQIFWVIENNKNAILRYQHYGFKFENLYDYIYVRKPLVYKK